MTEGEFERRIRDREQFLEDEEGLCDYVEMLWAINLVGLAKKDFPSIGDLERLLRVMEAVCDEYPNVYGIEYRAVVSTISAIKKWLGT